MTRHKYNKRFIRPPPAKETYHEENERWKSFGRGPGLICYLRCRRLAPEIGLCLRSVQAIDHLAGPSVVQALARLALDRVRIALEVLHVLFEPVIFLLKGVNLLMKLAILCTLLLVSVQAVVSHHHVVAENERQHNRQRRGDAPPHAEEEIRCARLSFIFGSLVLTTIGFPGTPQFVCPRDL